MIFECDGMMFRFSDKERDHPAGKQLVSYCHYGEFTIFIELLLEHFDPVDDNAKEFAAKRKGKPNG